MLVLLMCELLSAVAYVVTAGGVQGSLDRMGVTLMMVCTDFVLEKYLMSAAAACECVPSLGCHVLTSFLLTDEQSKLS